MFCIHCEKETKKMTFFMWSSCIVLLVLASYVSAQEFRTMNGSLNSRRDNGMAGSFLRRLAPANYSDGTGRPFEGINPRLLSNSLFNEKETQLDPNRLNDMFWSWGQFLDHDITAVPSSDEHHDLEIPRGDGFFEPGSLMPFKRSKGVLVDGVRQQSNTITAFIDGSQVYGSDHNLSKRLREDGGQGYRLIQSKANYLKWNVDKKTFEAGDTRAPEQPGLTMLHTIFLREHNRLADRIKQSFDRKNSSYNNETIYQTARLILGAELQKITYHEFLPLLLGKEFEMEDLSFSGRNPGIFNEFSTACFRFGHTMVPNHLSIRDASFCETSQVSLGDSFFNPNIFLTHGATPIIRGLLAQPSQGLDMFFVTTLRNFLFKNVPGEHPLGIDLAALNIQRAHDHGLADFCSVRDRLKMETERLKFGDITSNPQLAAALEEMYGQDPCAMDLFVGGLAEDPYRSSLLGKTCTKVINRQFVNLARGDRFFVSNMKWEKYGLEKDPVLDDVGTLLSEISLARILELNTDVGTLPRKVMKLHEDFKCRSYPDIV